MVRIPPGQVRMGMLELTDQYRHVVRIERSFALGKCPVTFAEWDAAVAAGADLPPHGAFDIGGWGRGRRPVICVSWFDAQAYLAWLNDKLGLTGRPDVYRLPSEAEWEYACRAGSKSKWSFGNDEAKADDYAWFMNNAGRMTHPVGEKRANPFGLHDMHGNVAEWCQDCLFIHDLRYGLTYTYPSSDGSAYEPPPGNCRERAVRGGSWGNDAESLRSACRAAANPAHRIGDVGFRVARTLENEPGETESAERRSAPRSPATRGDSRPSPEGTTSAGRRVPIELPGVAGWPGPEMIVIPPDRFAMGLSDDVESDGYEVRIAYPFALGRYPVTFAEWDAAVAAGAELPDPGDEGWGRGWRPVSNVNWFDAHAYLAWLNDKLGLTGRPDAYRLPSEAEWEYACRAGTTTNWYFGDDEADLNDHAWSNGNSGTTQPVGLRLPNPFGLYDMHGNVDEWCQDRVNYGPGRPSDGSAWTTGTCEQRVLRGGSFGVGGKILRGGAVARPEYRHRTFGFRLARTLSGEWAVSGAGRRTCGP
jgi:formylglycine-generating enzyme required for sulfatase activity